MDRLLDGGAAPARKRDRHRPMWQREVVDIDPVGRQRSRFGCLLQQSLHRLLHARTACPNHEYIEAALADRGSRVDRRISAWLIAQAGKRREVCGCLKLQPTKIGCPTETLNRHR
jgi:hypothetical protein